MISDLLAGLNEAEIQIIGDNSNTIEVETDTVIYRSGDAADSLYIVYSGEVVIIPEGLTRGKGSLNLGAGDFFGEIALIQGKNHASTAIATAKSSLLELKWEALDNLMHTNPLLLRNLNYALAERLRQTDQRVLKAITQFTDENARLLSRVSSALGVALRFNDVLDWNELWKQLLDEAIKSIGAERGTVYVLNRTTGCLEGMTIRGEGLSKIKLRPGQGLAGASVLKGAGIIANDTSNDERFAPQFDEISGFTTRSVLCMPFRDSSGLVLGVVQLLASRTDAFSVEDLTFLELFGDQFAMGYERSNSVRTIVAEAQKQLVQEVVGGVSRALPEEINPVNSEIINRFFRLIRLAYGEPEGLNLKPLRFKTFIEKVVQDAASVNPELNITISRDKLYDGFVTTDSELLLAVIESLIGDLTREKIAPLTVSAIDKNDTLLITIEGGNVPSDIAQRQLLSFQAARKLASLHGSKFYLQLGSDSRLFVTTQLPLAG